MNDFLKENIPNEIIYSIKEIIDDRTNGASYLARKVLGTIGRAAFLDESKNSETLLKNMDTICRMLSEARPSMSPVKLSALKLLHQIHILQKQYSNFVEFKVLIQKKAAELIRISFENFNKTVDNAGKILEKPTKILTCSKSSTINEILKKCCKNIEKVVICESRPLMEGRETASYLLSLGIDVTFITDCQAGLFVGSCDLVLVGADSILKNGYLVNKSGTYMIALAAKRDYVPFFTVCQTDKFSSLNFKKQLIDTGHEERKISTNKIPFLEEKEPKEVWDNPETNLEIRNIYFDVTPPDLLCGIITEYGLIHPDEVDKYIEKNSRYFQFKELISI